MRKRGATDFGPSGAKALEDISSQDMQLHHIFPFDFMMKDEDAQTYRETEKLGMSDFRWEVNSLANITFISRAKNAAIGNIPPWQYFEDETTLEVRKAHFIPNDKALWNPKHFGAFMEERRRLLSAAMNSLIKQLN